MRRNFYNKPLATFNWDWKVNDMIEVNTSLYASAGRGGGTGPRGRGYYNSTTDILPYRKDLTEHYNENGRGARDSDGCINFDAVVNYLINENRDVILLCSGWKGLFNLEDTILSGKLASVLMNNGFQNNNDSTLAAIELFRLSDGNLFNFLSNSSHRKRLQSLNMEEDTKFCLNPTFKSDLVPILKDGRLVKL